MPIRPTRAARGVTTPRSSYAGLPISYLQFKDLVLIHLADAWHDHVDEYGRRLPDDDRAYSYSIKKIADHDRLKHTKQWLIDAIVDLEFEDSLAHDLGDSDKNEDDGFGVYLNQAGYFKAEGLVEKHYGRSKINSKKGKIKKFKRVQRQPYVNVLHPDFKKTIIALENLIEKIRGSNALPSDTKDQLLGELRAGLEVLKTPRPDRSLVERLVHKPARFMARHAAEALIGAAAVALAGLAAKLLGLA